LGVPHYVLDMANRFGRDVVDDFVHEYARGRTPIPCVRCNTFTKFRDLLHRADAIDARYIATGHYARIVDGTLRRGVDPRKDQSYFLWGIDHAVVQRMLLPIGVLSKPETRARISTTARASKRPEYSSHWMTFSAIGGDTVTGIGGGLP